jgi:hypothetical protein
MVRCACGFTEDLREDYTVNDHLLEMFAPEDCVAADGTEHAEGKEGFRCLCGAGGSQEALDLHFQEVFTPADSTGRDGAVHKALA